MRLAIVLVSLAAGVGLFSLACTALPRPASTVAPSRGPETLVDKLNRVGDFEKIDDWEMNLQEALDQLSREHNISFKINHEAFAYEGYKDVEGTLIAEPKPQPALKQARLCTRLQALLDRIPLPSGVVYMIRADHIEITSKRFQNVEVWGEHYSGPHLPLVSARFERRPLREALQELANQAQFNLLLDERAAERTRRPVTATLLHVPLDTALTLLASMADLHVIQRDSVFYVTTRESAEALERRFSLARPLFDSFGDRIDPARWRKSPGPPVHLEGGAAGASSM
jgi:hypothetical protein